MPPRRPSWITETPVAHRGLHDDAGTPENSVGAFEAAIAAGYGIELDIHLTADDRLVVFHDDNTERLTGRDLTVTDTTYDELSTLTLDGTDYRIPLLTDVLAVVSGRVPLLVEVKTGSPMHRVGPRLAEALGCYTGDIAVQSFDPRVLLWLRRHLPRVVRGQISGSFADADRLPVAQRMLLRSMLLNLVNRPDFIAFEVGAMPDRFVTFWRRSLRIPLLLWTVTTDQDVASANRFDANVIFEKVKP